jgi:hypothetical protein
MRLPDRLFIVYYIDMNRYIFWNGRLVDVAYVMHQLQWHLRDIAFVVGGAGKHQPACIW